MSTPCLHSLKLLQMMDRTLMHSPYSYTTLMQNLTSPVASKEWGLSRDNIPLFPTNPQKMPYWWLVGNMGIIYSHIFVIIPFFPTNPQKATNAHILWPCLGTSHQTAGARAATAHSGPKLGG